MSTSAPYPTNVSDEQWSVLQLMLPEAKRQPGGPGRPPLDLRRVLDGTFYVNKTGGQWRMMPRDLGNAMTIYGYFRRWRQQGVWSDLMDTLRIWERRDRGRKDDPSAACADSQRIKVMSEG
jgi:putative transposase